MKIAVCFFPAVCHHFTGSPVCFPFYCGSYLYSGISRDSCLPSGVSSYQDTGLAHPLQQLICWGFSSCSLVWDVKHPQLSMFRRLQWLIFFISSWRKDLLLLFFLGLPSLKTAACILIIFFAQICSPRQETNFLQKSVVVDSSLYLCPFSFKLLF